jgi:hypothetical protein
MCYLCTSLLPLQLRWASLSLLTSASLVHNVLSCSL